MAEKWIQKALKPSTKGALRKELGVKEGKTIPAKKLAAAAKNVGYFVSSLAQALQPLLAVAKGVLDFASIPFVARVGVYATVISLLTQTFVLLRNTGIIQATIAMIRFMATLSVAQIRVWVAGIQSIIAVLFSMIRTADLARLSLMALKVSLISIGVGAVLIGLDFVAQRLLKIGSAADDARLKAAALTDELNRAVEAGDTAVASAKYVEAETKVQSLTKARDLLLRLQQGQMLPLGRGGISAPMSQEEFGTLRRTGAASGMFYNQGRVTATNPGQVAESLRIVQTGLVNALNEAGQAKEAMQDAAQVAQNNQRQIDASRKQLSAVPLAAKEEKASKRSFEDLIGGEIARRAAELKKALEFDVAQRKGTAGEDKQALRMIEYYGKYREIAIEIQAIQETIAAIEQNRKIGRAHV